jgi:MFS family permease
VNVAEAADEQQAERLLSRPFLAVTGATLVFFVYVGVLVPLVPKYIEDELRGGELGVGLAIASFAGVAIAVRPLIGHLVMRYGRRAVMAGGAALAAVAGVAYGYTDSLPLLLLLRGVTGAGEAALFVAAMTLVADLSPPDRRAEAASYFSVAVFGGIGIGPIIGEALLGSSGFRSAFVVGGLFAAAAAVLSIVVPKRYATARRESAADEEPGNPAQDSDETAVPQPVGARRWLHPAAVGPGAVLAIGSAAFIAFSAFLPDHSRALGLSGSGGLFAVYSAVCLVVRVAGARLPERVGARVSVTTAFAMIGVGLALLAAVPQPWALWVAAAAVGFGMAFMYPSLMAFTVNRTPDAERPRAIASFTMFFEVGTAAGGLLLGSVANSMGKRAGFTAAVALCLIGVWLVRNVVIPPSYGERREPVPAGASLAAATSELH